MTTLFHRIFLISFGLILLITGTQSSAEQVPMNKIVAIVDKGIILQNQLNEQVKLTLQRLSPEQRATVSTVDLEKRILERMVITELQLQIARRSGLTVSEQEIDQSIDRVAKANNLDREGFLKLLAKDNISVSSFRRSIKEQIIVRRVQAGFVRQTVKISDQEVDSFLRALEQSGQTGGTEYRVGHILISTPENASPEQINKAQKKAEFISNALDAGEAFSTLSIAHSDASNALEGGDLGWLKLSQMPSLLKPYVEQMQTNESSKPIQSPSGFHVIQLFETRGQQKVMVTKTHVRHILIKTNALVSDQIAQERLSALKERIENGEDFITLARANSEDRGSAIKGGDLDWVQPGALVPPFEHAMNQLDINQLSQPIQTQFGWHLIQVLGREQQDNTALLKKARARSQLQKRKADAAIEAWLAKLRDDAYIEYRLQ